MGRAVGWVREPGGLRSAHCPLQIIKGVVQWVRRSLDPNPLASPQSGHTLPTSLQTHTVSWGRNGAVGTVRPSPCTGPAHACRVQGLERALDPSQAQPTTQPVQELLVEVVPHRSWGRRKGGGVGMPWEEGWAGLHPTPPMEEMEGARTPQAGV